jgi:hypothetical protein
VCEDRRVRPQRYTATLTAGGRGRLFVPVPFDPDQVWRPKPQHHITGTINGVGIRAVIETHHGQRGFTLGPAWLRDCRVVAVGDTATVEIMPEGPNAMTSPRTSPPRWTPIRTPGAFFDSLAQFYCKAYLRWIDATKRRPDLRAQRIAEMIRLLDAGIKQRPQT